MSESVERVNNLLHAALLMRVEPGDRPPGAGYPLRLHRMEGEDWVDARDRIEAAKAHVVRVAEDILPADIMMTDRAFRVLEAVEALSDATRRYLAGDEAMTISRLECMEGDLILALQGEADGKERVRVQSVTAAAKEWAGAVVDERRFYEMSRSLEGAPTVEWEAAAMRLSVAEAALLAAVLGEAEG